ncbi:MAG: M12 family metallo-peptidase [Thiolinea sp.]
MGFAKSLGLMAPVTLLTSLLVAPLSAAEQLSFKDTNFAAAMYQAKQAQVAAVPLEANRTAELELEQFEVFAPNASIIVKSSTGTQTLPLPQTSYFKGKVAYQDNSAAFMATDLTGKTRSIVQMDGQIYVNNSNAKSSQSSARALDPAKDFKQQQFACGIEGQTTFKPPLPAGIKAKLSTAARVGAEGSDNYVADLIIETDYEFYSLFNNATTATQYVSDLIAYISSIYTTEIKTRLRLKEVVLYTSPNDPWSAESTESALYEVQSYYLANRASTERSTVHFLSGKENMNGGIAYIASICTAPVYGGRQGSYDFGVSGGLSGSFTPNNPLIVWDAYVVAHELGHNFGSSHTHSYDVDHGYNLPVDCCYSQAGGACQNYQPRMNLPGLGTLTGGTSANHPGTIMSYCHLVSGGSQNVSMTFGTNHPYGVEANRVPAEMRATVEAYASAYPQCLPIDTPVTASFGFKKLTQWHDFFVTGNAIPLVGDFNGDHLEDVASFTHKRQVYVALSNGSALGSKTLWKSNFATGTEQVATGDFNGDGKADLVNLTHNAKRQIYVALSNGSSFEANTLWFGLKTAEDGRQVIGDFDGDDKDDVATIKPETGLILVNLSTGNAFRVQRQWNTTAALGAKQIVVGDFNGDAKADLGFSTATGEFRVSLSTGSSFTASTTWHSNLAKNIDQLVAGDFNADGKDDIASYLPNAAGGIYLALAEEGKFGLNQKAHAWFEPYNQILKAGLFTEDGSSGLMSFTRGMEADVWVATDLQ